MSEDWEGVENYKRWLTEHNIIPNFDLGEEHYPGESMHRHNVTTTTITTDDLRKVIDYYAEALEQEQYSMERYKQYVQTNETPSFVDAIEEFLNSLQRLFEIEWELIVERWAYIVGYIVTIISIIVGSLILDWMGYVNLY